jgi:NDP-sugar pyrophosphorylase family protein
MTIPGLKGMILAAGVGSRLEPLTSFRPKPLAPVGNRPIMEHAINLLQKHGMHEIVSNTHYLADTIMEYFGDGSRFGAKLEFRREQELSGDAGGVRACEAFLKDGPFVVTMGDLLTDIDLTALVKAHLDNKALATIAVRREEDVTRFGVVVTDAKGQITGFQEKPSREEARSNLISAGIYVLDPEIFRYIPKDGQYNFGKQLFPQLVASQLPVFAREIDGYWSDIGTIQSYWEANRDATENKLSLTLPGNSARFGLVGTGSIISDPDSIEGNLVAGNNTSIGSGVRVRGHVVIGNNCTIGSNCQLENCIIWDNVKVESGASLQNCVLAFHCLMRIKPSQN